MKEDMFKILGGLSLSRPVYYSEADFQHTLAWEIQKLNPEAAIRLEYPFHSSPKSAYIDILIKDKGKTTAIELKYKTARLEVGHNNENYTLKNQSAQDLGRYDYLKDIERLETYCRLEKDWHGISIFLTNDATYWKNPICTMTVDSYFRIHESRSIQGSLAWGEKAKLGTIKTREKIITLMGSYTMQWFEYSDFATGRNSKFRFLLHEVNPSGAGEKAKEINEELGF